MQSKQSCCLTSPKNLINQSTKSSWSISRTETREFKLMISAACTGVNKCRCLQVYWHGCWLGARVLLRVHTPSMGIGLVHGYYCRGYQVPVQLSTKFSILSIYRTFFCCPEIIQKSDLQSHKHCPAVLYTKCEISHSSNMVLTPVWCHEDWNEPASGFAILPKSSSSLSVQY